MPQVYNGCGTWYYGKGNRQSYTGTCRYCRRTATLTSYDTTLFVVIIFVPIIPLGRKRIIEQCPACRRHTVSPLKSWRQGAARAGETAAAYRQSPHDPALALEAMRAVVGLRDATTFAQLAPDIEKNLASDPKTLKALAEAYGIFGREDETERLLNMSMAIQDTAETREAIAANLLRRGKPDEAKPYLQHVIDQGIPDRVDLVYHLAQHYQAQGRHDEALEAFDQCTTISPAIQQDKQFAKLRAASEKRRGTAKPVPLGSVSKRDRSSRSSRRALVGLAAILAVASLIYLAFAVYLGFSTKVYLVNGLSRPYSVRLNNSTYKLEPNSVTPVRIGQGSVSVQIADVQGAPPAEQIRIQTPYLSRPADSSVFLINPDEAALIEKRRVYYRPEGVAGRDADHDFSVGHLLQTYTHIDYPFREFPTSISMDQNSSEEHYDGLILVTSLPGVSPPVLLVTLADKLGKDNVTHALARHVILDAQPDEYLPYLDRFMNNADLAALLRGGLDSRPVRMIWHRTYQDAMSAAGQDDELEKQYAAYLAADPTNADLMYLAGRAARDYDKAMALYHQAAAAPNPPPFVFYSMCSAAMESGDFAAAADFGDKAMNTIGTRPEVRYYVRKSNIAAGRADRTLEICRMDEQSELYRRVAAFDDEVYIETVANNPDGANSAIDQGYNSLKALDSDYAESWRRRAQVNVQYVNGNTIPLSAFLSSSSDSSDKFSGDILTNHPDAADQDLQSLPNRDAEADLLLYIISYQSPDKSLATRHWQAALDKLSHGDAEDRLAADAMTSVTKTASALRARITPDEKAIILTALCCHDPAAAADCAALAAKLNFDHRFPYMTLRDALAALPAGVRPQ